MTDSPSAFDPEAPRAVSAPEVLGPDAGARLGEEPGHDAPAPGAPAPGDPMAPADVAFLPVSPRLAHVRVVSTLLSFAPLLIAAIVLALLVSAWFWIGVGLLVVLGLWILWLIPRQVRAMGYALADDEFLIRKGVMFRHLTLIPFGRIQYVAVSEGPIARAFGIAEIRLHTASAETSGTLNGVPSIEAVRLRDMLSEKGSAETAGL